MISIILGKMPDPILEKTLTLRELTQWKTLKHPKLRIIEREIHDIRLTNPNEADVYFSKKFKIRLSAMPRWGEVKERFYRRNAIIHRHGEPDQKYREKTGRQRVRPLDVSTNYLATSITLFRMTASRVARALERKFGTR